MSIRIYFEVRGGHVHCRVFIGNAKNMTHAHVGELTLAVEEWDTFRDVMQSRVEFIEDQQ